MKNSPLVWVVNGPNLNKLGSREVQIYGEKSLTEINSDLSKIAEIHSIEIDFFQEGFDVCLQTGQNSSGILEASEIFPVRRLIAATPEYIKNNTEKYQNYLDLDY